MNSCLPWETTPTDADGGETAPAAGAKVVPRLIVVMQLTAAALDLIRCRLVIAAARHPGPTAGLAAAELTAGTRLRKSSVR